MFDTDGSAVSALLRKHGAATWEAAVRHAMVIEIAAGSLPHERFRGYFEQNIAYLEEYARAIAHIAAKAPDSDALTVTSAMLAQIVSTELPANRRFLERLGGSPAAVRGVATMQPTTYGYTRHLLAAAALGDCATGLAAVLPCQWSYGEIGVAIGDASPDDSIYADWIEMFGNDEYAALVEATTGLLDRLAAPCESEAFTRLRAIFDTSTRYELEFWDMAYDDLPALV
jgi:thiaminase/transcriptional activator TenA